jgi:P-type conjugative transfer protein TrbJ
MTDSRSHVLRRLAACVATCALALAIAVPARAQLGPMPVIDISAIQQAINQLNQLQQTYQQTVNMVSTLKNQYQQMLIAGQTLNPTQLSQMSSALNQLQSLPGLQTQIAGINTQLLQTFEKDYPTYHPDANYTQVLQTLNNNTNASLSDAYSQMQAQNQDIQLEQNYLSQLLLNANNATGEMQALQAANGFLSILNQQMLKLRQIQLAMLRNQTAYMKTMLANVAAGGGGGGSGGVVNSTLTSQDTAWLNYLGISAQQTKNVTAPSPTPSPGP